MRWRSVARRLPAAGMAAANIIAVSAMILVLGANGVAQQELVAFSVLVVSAQAGQATVVQVGHSPVKNPRWLAASALTGVIFAAVLADLEGYEGTNGAAVAAICGGSGLIFGIAAAGSAYSALASGQRNRYQAVILTRTITWGVIVWLTILYSGLSALWGTAVAWAIIGLTLAIKGNSGAVSGRRDQAAVWIGAIAGLVYRNDVNVARSLAVGARFDFWNTSLVVYSISQAVLGFIAVNEIYSRRIAIRQWFMNGTLRTLSLASSAAVLGCLAAGILVNRQTWHYSDIASVGLVLIAGSCVAIQATVAHVSGYSIAVYVGGAGGFAALVGAGMLQYGPAVSLLIEFAVSALTVTIALISFENGRIR